MEYKYNNGEIYQGDCLELMKDIPDKSIDMILCDLPYGTTECKWDSVIPFDNLWEQYERIIKDNGAIVLTATQPFTSKLVLSNIKLFKYSLVWRKTRIQGFAQAPYRFMTEHEDILADYRDWETDRKSTRLNSSHEIPSRMPSSA